MPHHTNIFYRNVSVDLPYVTKKRAGWIILPDGVASFKVPTNLRGKRGRINIDAGELGEFVSIIVVKATDWDSMDPQRIKPNLYRHRNQICRYIEDELIDDDRDNSPAIIYMHAPRTPGLQTTIEEYFCESGIQVVWRRK